MSQNNKERVLDDAVIVGGSPTDRIIGMLLERTEAIRELHDSMRQEFKLLITTHTDIKGMMVRMGERQDSHERNDTSAFTAINSSHATIVAKLDSLSAQINAARNEAIIQKAQLTAGWKVIVVVGGIIAACFAIFAIFFNHAWK